jgi:hypothetical protein
MVNGLWKISAFLMIVVLLVIYPVLQMLEIQDDIVQMRLMEDAHYFVQRLKVKGYCDANDYNWLVHRLESLGHMFTVEFEHEKFAFIPNYLDPSDESSFQNTFSTASFKIGHNEIMSHLFSDSLLTNTAIKKYVFNDGDYFAVVIYNQQRTRAQVLRDALWLTRSIPRRFYVRVGTAVGAP